MPGTTAGPRHPNCLWIEADLGSGEPPFDSWLTEVEAAVNTVGIFSKHDGARFDALHTYMPVSSVFWLMLAKPA